MEKMMVNVWLILVAASSAVTVSAVYTSQKRLSHGNYLTLDLPERTDKLHFSSADEKYQDTIWKKKTLFTGKASKGVVTSVNNGYTFKINHVTFDDQGTYTLLNSFDTIISTYIVKVETKRRIIDRVPGETLTIPLDGVKLVDATLRFNSNYSAITLVENGVPVGKENPDYVNRLRVSSDIQVLNVNVSDLGRYTLRDQKGRLVSNTTMILVDHHPNFTPNKGLLALLLLGIPGSICFCCRKRICKCCKDDKSQTASPPPESIPICTPVTDPAQGNVAGPGQVPNYYPPPDQGPIQYPPPDQGPNQYPLPQWNGQPAVPPNPGFNSEYTPQNPLYPPVPGVSPAHPPQWSGPTNQYNPPAPVNYNAMMNSAPSGPEPPMYQIGATSPMLNAQPESAAPRASVDILNSSHSADVQFNIDKSKSPTNNFL